MTILAYKDLFYNLCLKELKIRYMGSWLGLVWSLLPPLLFTIFYSFIFAHVVPLKGQSSVHIVMTGYLHWYFFAQVMAQSCDVLVGNAWLFKKVGIPKLLVNLSSFAVTLMFWMLLLVLYVGLSWWQGYTGWFSPVYLLLLLSFIGFCFGLSLIVSISYVYFRDTRYIIEVALQALFWLSPVLYSWKAVPAFFSDLYVYNPLAVYIISFQEVLLAGAGFSVRVACAVLYSLLSLGAAFWLYSVRKGRLVEAL